MTQDTKDVLLRWVLLLLPALYAITSALYITDLPYLDDYDQMLAHLAETQAAEGLEWWRLMFSERNEHRAIFYHFMHHLIYAIHGQVSVSALIWVGVIVHLATYTGWILLCQRLVVGRLWQLAVALIWLVPPAIAMHWTSAAMVYAPFLCGAVWTWYLLLGQRGRLPLVGALLATALAISANAAGLIVALTALPLLWHRYGRRVTLAWILGIVGIGLLYFMDNTAAQAPSSVQLFSITGLFSLCANLIFYLGSAWRSVIGQREYLYLLPALVWVGTLAYYFTSPRDRRHDAIMISVVSFTLLLGGALALGRIQYGPAASFAMRYELFHVMPWIILILVVAYLKPRSSSSIGILIAGIAFITVLRWSDNTSHLALHRQKLEGYMDAYLLTNDPSYLLHKRPSYGQSILDEAVASGRLQLEPSTHTAWQKLPRKPATKEPIRGTITMMRQERGITEVKGYATLAHKAMAKTTRWIILSDGEQYWAHPTLPLIDHGAPEQVHTSSFFMVDKTHEIPLPPGTYEVHIALRRAGLGWLGVAETGSKLVLE